MDIDIDTQTKFDPLMVFPGVIRATMLNKQKLRAHPAGAYFQNIPTDALNPTMSAIPYDKADALGFTKIDFLHLHILDSVASKAQVRELAQQEPDWKLLADEDFVQQLFHIGQHFDIIRAVTPRSVDDLADCLALIRPGKRRLLPQYLTNKQLARAELYRPTDGYYFKRSHAISYAVTIVVQINLLATKADISTALEF